MKRYLFNLVSSIVLMLVCMQAFSQVKLFDSGDTKFYDGGTRITYFEMEDFPNSVEMREFVTKKVLEHPDIRRAFIYKNGTTFMYDGAKDVEPNMVVDAINEALVEYENEIGPIYSDKEEAGKPKSTSVESMDRNMVIEEPAPAEPASFEAVPVERPSRSTSKKSNDSIKTK